MSVGLPMNTPRATMRLQFHKGFTFDNAIPIVPYMAALHVSHLYASPIMTAKRGSVHGYDVVDPTQVNPELGGEPALERLVAALRGASLGIIVDIVPNHVAVGEDNPWWVDLLRHGRASRYARYFDIDWEPPDRMMHGKVLIPVLDRPYGTALSEGEIVLRYNAFADHYEVRYFHHVFPIDPAMRPDIERSTLAAFDSKSEKGRERLHELLELQNFRLAWWRTANDDINWRRFFDVNELAALRVEDDEVFEATHAKLFQLFSNGLIDGVRIDHVDGLTDPAVYCRKIRKRLDALAAAGPRDRPRGPAYVVVEKILGTGEVLPADWGCDGTSGYDFMDQISSVLHDPAGEVPLGRVWSSISGRPMEFAIEEQSARRELLNRSFTAQLTTLVSALHSLARADISTRDLTRASIQRSLIEILTGMRVYRTYRMNGATKIDEHLAAAVGRARNTTLRIDRDTIKWLRLLLSGDAAMDLECCRLGAEARRRFRQLSAPLAAKAVEDTAFYRHGRLLSRVDVGFDAGRFFDSVETFHQKSLQRREEFSNGMLATATHDHKRGEDVRARLAVLSEISGEWAQCLDRWMAQTVSLRSQGGITVSSGDTATLFQTIVGAWSPQLSLKDRKGCTAFRERLAAWQQKAVREAKLFTEWSVPNEPYELVAHNLLEAIFASSPSKPPLDEMETFAHRIAAPGAVNGLSQVLAKLTSPGVPDLYQGTEFWDLSLVDPDNRRPVDFGARMEALRTEESIADLARDWQNGRIKQAIIRRSLAFRQTFPALFSRGHYLPLVAVGPASDHIIAFARVDEQEAAITVVTRFATRLLKADSGISIPTAAWENTKLRVPAKIGCRFWDVLASAKVVATDEYIPLPSLLKDLPVALLTTGWKCRA
jgi:(1->4)-alpha-D-glucan 1-alpha-D-glucosylmutase